jgi:glycosyltransferase involved in cell wall biosynthesis
MHLELSVVICAYNAERRLPPTLEHLAAQQGVQRGAWEIVLIDNASTDATAAVFQNFAAAHPDLNCRHFHEPRPGKTNALKLAFEVVSAPLILLVDDDNWISPNYVADSIQWMRKLPDAAGLGGIGELASDHEPPGWFAEKSEWYAIHKRPWPQGSSLPVDTLWGAGSVYRLAPLREFSRATSLLKGRAGADLVAGEDIELSLFLKSKNFGLYLIPSLHYFHYMPQSRMQWEYLERLHAASGACGVALDVYRLHWMNPAARHWTGWLRRQWAVQFVYTSLRVIFSSGWWPGLPRQRESRLNWLMYWGRLRTLWRDRKEYGRRMSRTTPFESAPAGR